MSSSRLKDLSHLCYRSYNHEENVNEVRHILCPPRHPCQSLERLKIAHTRALGEKHCLLRIAWCHSTTHCVYTLSPRVGVAATVTAVIAHSVVHEVNYLYRMAFRNRIGSNTRSGLLRQRCESNRYLLQRRCCPHTLPGCEQLACEWHTHSFWEFLTQKE